MNGAAITRIIITIIVAFACESNAAQGQDLGSLDTDFHLALSPVSSPQGIVANIETTSMYPCAGYGIRLYVTWEQDTISIHITGLVQPSPCIPTGDNATGTAYLGDLGPGNYFIRISYRGETDLHKMALIPGLATIKPVRDHFTRIEGF